MDDYFKNLYVEVHPNGTNPDIRVLAAPMAQSLYAEEVNVVDCSAYDPQVEGRAGGLLWMEYTWLEWANVPRAVWERHLGQPFDAGDFISFRGGEHQPYPETWDVMF